MFGRQVGDESYLRVKVIQSLDGSLDVATVDAILDLLSRNDGGAILVRLEICFFGKVRRSVRIPFHSKVIQNQGVDVTARLVSV